MYELVFRDADGYLQVTVSGRLDAATDALIDADIRRECERRRAPLVLVDIRPARTRLSLFDNHEAAKSFRARMGNAVQAVAIVDNPAFGANSQMFENTAVNRGAAVRFFDDEAPAAAWLRGIADASHSGAV